MYFKKSNAFLSFIVFLALHMDHATIKSVIPCSNVSANYSVTVVVNVSSLYENISQIRLKTRESGNNLVQSELTVNKYFNNIL